MHEDLTEMEQQLRSALREPPAMPEGLEDRIVQAVLRGTQKPQRMQLPRWAPVAAVLVLAVLLGFAEGYRQGQQARQRHALFAAQQFAMAMHVTDSTLQHVAAHLDGQLERVALATQEGEGDNK